MDSPAECARQAAALAARGQDTEAAALFEAGLARFASDAGFANSAGNFHARARRDERAAALFECALRIDPGFDEAAINAAIVLLRLGRARAACNLLQEHENAGAGKAQYWALRGDCAKALGEYDLAADYYARGLAVEPGSIRPLKGRARLALERGEPRAIADYETLLAGEPGNFELMADYVRALQAAGQTQDAREFAQALTAHFPGWIGGLALLAELRWSAGEAEGYTAHFEDPAAGEASPELYLEWAALLSGTDRFDAAAAVLDRAQTRWPEDARIVLARGIALGEAGRAAEAEAVLRRGDRGDNGEWALARARNELRMGRVDAAEARLETLTASDIGNVAAWSLLDLCWRLRGDKRHEWLHGQPGLVREIELPLDAAQLEALRQALLAQHRRSAVPLAQSVKQGTQTKGALFARFEREIALLREAIGAAVEAYRTGLPGADAAHPLLSRRDERWMIAGSWSVRFAGKGHHAAHIHPRGIVSSACYIVVPPEVDDPGGPGWLELGRPPPGLADELGSLVTIKPRPGMCALFPSTLFHGTRALSAGERMTVAFDVAVERG